jgi:hypothetical protein
MAIKMGGRKPTCKEKNLVNVTPDIVSPPFKTFAANSPTTGKAVGILVTIVVAQ